jgi:hypothetical protein
MFATRNSMLSAAVLLLVLLLALGAPAVAREGVWVYPNDGGWMSISLVNLTDYPLLITQNTCSLWTGDKNFLDENSIPFQGHGELNLAPYRTATWRSSDPGTNIASRGEFAWEGSLSLLPAGMDPKWTVTVKMHMESASGLHIGRGTWVYLTVSGDPVNTEWGDAGWHYGVWATPIPATPSVTSGLYNVMTTSGTRLAVSLYSPDNSNLTLVIRQTNWDGAEVDDYTGWQLDFEDNNTETMPD